jgi:hypothetical protein
MWWWAMEYTYEPPDSEAFMEALLIELKHEILEIYDLYIEREILKLYNLLKNAECEIYHNNIFSRKIIGNKGRWNAYAAIVRFKIPTNNYDKAKRLEKSKIWEIVKDKLIEVCNKIMPPECGFDVVDVEFKPLLKYQPKTGQIIKPQKYLNPNDFNFPDSYFYKNLIEEINKCYNVGAYSAVRILTRKLLENLLIDVLKKKYYGKDDDKFYNKNDGRFHGFNTLLKNFKEAFKDDSVITNNELGKLTSKLKKFKEEGDINAHSIIIKPEKSDIDREKEHLIYLINALTKIYNDIKE